ncbi:hypothetical protein LN042_24135 [Kitasatospora sp. RB6PN24]|uniref:hypothetical protein n=1 Tax=Kitasatospora humi TaxID=2893891 RepID=UPI001E5960A6|nr:hypothetical protein [Kitasatospora humi]MCC9310119.1 hypothetical protein [Kitasatospora humi]
MADTATLAPVAPDSALQDPDDGSVYVVDNTPQPAAETTDNTRPSRRRRVRAVPALIHSSNAAGAVIGAAYTFAGPVGAATVGAAGAVAGAAALYRRRPKGGARRGRLRGAGGANQAAGTNRSGGGSQSGPGPGRRGGGTSGPTGGAQRQCTNAASGSNRTASTGTSTGSGSGAGPGRGGAGNSPGPGRSGGGNTQSGASPSGGGRSGGQDSASGRGRDRSKGGASGNDSSRNGGGDSRLKRTAQRLKDKLSGGNNSTRGSGTGGGGTGNDGSSTPGSASTSSKGSTNATKGSGKTGAGTVQPKRSGRASQAVKAALAKLRRKNGGSGTGTSGSTTPTTRRGRAWQAVKSAVGKLRRKRPGTANPAAAGTATAAGRWYRLRRTAVRKVLHVLRCTGAGLLAGLGALATLPLGVLWGLASLITRPDDPMYPWLLPIRVAGRIWRALYRRSKRRHDLDAKADGLNLTVNDPLKDDPMSDLANTSIVLNGTNARFALAMRGTYDHYASYRPTSMAVVAAEYAGLPNALRATAEAIRFLASNADSRYPCSKRAIEKLVEAYGTLMNAGQRADEMVVLFRNVHRFDLERLRNPRNGEWMWNVTPIGSDVPGEAMFAPGRIETAAVTTAVLYKTYEPEHMLQVGQEFAGIGVGLEALAAAMKALYERTRDEYPVDDRVTNEIAGLVQMVLLAADHARLAAKLFAEDHAREIRNNLQPRKGLAGESMWNTQR